MSEKREHQCPDCFDFALTAPGESLECPRCGGGLVLIDLRAPESHHVPAKEHLQVGGEAGIVPTKGLGGDAHQAALWRLAAVGQYLYDTMGGDYRSSGSRSPLPEMATDSVRAAQRLLDRAIRHGQRTRPACLGGEMELAERWKPEHLAEHPLDSEGGGERLLAGVDSGDLTRSILEELEAPCDDPEHPSPQMGIQARIEGWFYTVCWSCKKRVPTFEAEDWEERPCPDNADYECSWCPECVAGEASADA